MKQININTHADESEKGKTIERLTEIYELNRLGVSLVVIVSLNLSKIQFVNEKNPEKYII